MIEFRMFLQLAGCRSPSFFPQHETTSSKPMHSDEAFLSHVKRVYVSICRVTMTAQCSAGIAFSHKAVAPHCAYTVDRHAVYLSQNIAKNIDVAALAAQIRSPLLPSLPSFWIIRKPVQAAHYSPVFAFDSPFLLIPCMQAFLLSRKKETQATTY